MRQVTTSRKAVFDLAGSLVLLFYYIVSLTVFYNHTKFLKTHVEWQ
jgi:hypothetical protein